MQGTLPSLVASLEHKLTEKFTKCEASFIRVPIAEVHCVLPSDWGGAALESLRLSLHSKHFGKKLQRRHWQAATQLRAAEFPRRVASRLAPHP